MSGYIARKGFRYQDLYLLLRVLEATGSALYEGWGLGNPNLPARLDNPSLRFGIEGNASSTTPGTLDWDILIDAPASLELAELKSGAITRDDRLAFWRRIRREGPTTLKRVAPTLVVDPDTAGQLEHFSGLAEFARGAAAITPALFDGHVNSTEKLYKEALWTLCEPDTTYGPPLEPPIARETIARFSLRTLRSPDLEARVESFINTLWPASHAAIYEPLLTGWLNQRATSPDPQRRFFTLRELLANINILELSTAFDAARLHAWQTLWTELPRVVEQRTRGRLGQSGASVESKDVQPAAVDALTAGTHSLVIQGIGGAGKSTFLAQAVKVATTRGDLVLWCGADDPSLAEIDSVADAFRFRASLASLCDPARTACLFVDGLDETAPNKRTRWAELLPRLSQLPNLRVIATVRATTFRDDGNLRQKLSGWIPLDLGEWPVAVVERLLATTAYAGRLPAGVLQLLRTPILLDLFWSTFVENPSPDMASAARLRSRHELLAAFWDRRLVNSARHTSIPNRVPALLSVFSHAAKSVGSFQIPADPALTLLLSEGVLVEEGRLQGRINFRHPLLRDFSFAQWCLSATNASEVALRWRAIAGGLQRYGALRAILEALAGPDAATEYPCLTFTDFMQALVTHDAAASQLAQLLGSFTEINPFDPSRWPHTLQSSLPSSFGSDVLASAKLNENPAWAAASDWPTSLPWIDDQFLHEFWRYAELLLEKSKRNPAGPWQVPLHRVVRRLRILAEDPRFGPTLMAAQEWLGMTVTNCVAQALPDSETLAWLERRLPTAGWRVRNFIADHLNCLARTDAHRTASLLRLAIGLGQKDGVPVLNGAQWNSPLSDHNLRTALGVEGTDTGLLAEFPEAFFPVALDLVHALHDFKYGSASPTHTALDNIRKEMGLGSSDQPPDDPAALIDDQPRWTYWKGFPSSDVQQRTLRLIHDKAKILQQSNPALFYSAIAPLLRGSRLATVQSFALDLLLEQRTDTRSLPFLCEAVLDARLYAIADIDHWLQQLLLTTWPGLDSAQRTTVQDIIAKLLQDEHAIRRAKRLLSTLPAGEWRRDLAALRPTDQTPEFRPSPRPLSVKSGQPYDDPFGYIPDDRPSKAPGSWPAHFGESTLLQLHDSTDLLRESDVTPETIQQERPAALTAGTTLALLLKSDLPTLTEEDNAWIWDAFKVVLHSYQKDREQPNSPRPPPEFVRACADLGMAIFSYIPADLPGKLPEGQVWTGYRDSAWTRALDLLDEALVWDPARDDQTLQAEFITVIERAFASGSPLLQLLCSSRMRPYHWLRSPQRRTLYRRLVWESPSDPRIPLWSVSTASRAGDVERTEIYRLGLNLTSLAEAHDLAGSIGNFLGICCILVLEPAKQRSTAAVLTREIIADPARFPLLRNPENQAEFWHHFAFGLKERAMLDPTQAQLAPEYGQWMRAAWKAMRACQARNRSETIILFATHWMERKNSDDTAKLLPWWQSVQPLLTDVVTEGSPADCFNIFFNFRDGPFNHLANLGDVLGFVDRFADRLISGTRAQTLDLDVKDSANDEHHSWRECANYAAQTVESLFKGGLLLTALQLDHAHRLLTRLSAAPIRSPDAAKALHSLQRD